MKVISQNGFTIKIFKSDEEDVANAGIGSAHVLLHDYNDLSDEYTMIILEPKKMNFETASNVLIAYIATEHHPHVKSIVCGNSAILMEGMISNNNGNFIPD